MEAIVVNDDPYDNYEIVSVNGHRIQFGGPDGDGFCYAHQSFGCLDNLTDEERRAVRETT